MKKVFLLILICSFSPVFAYSQNSDVSEIQKLNLQVSDLYRQSKFEEAIVIAEKIIEIQEKDKNKNFSDLAIALKNLAILQKNYDELLGEKIADSTISKSERFDLITKRRKFYDSIPVIFEKAIKIYEEKLKSENLSLAEIKFEYASYISRNQGKLVGMGSSEPDKVESLYKDSLSIREKQLGASNDLTLSTVLQIANFYQKEGNFEKSLPFYLNFLKGIEKKYGEKSEYLLQPLRIYLKILTAAQMEQEAEKIRQQISAITGNLESLPQLDLDLTLRNKADKSKELIENPNTITKYLKKLKFLLVEVIVDEKGNVIEAKAGETQDKDINGKEVQKKAEKDVKDWQFRPLIYDGKARKIKGIVWFPYFIKA